MRGRFLRFFVCTTCVMAVSAFPATGFAAEPDNSEPTSVSRAEPGIFRSLTDAALLRRVQAANEDLYASLQYFVCGETVVRTRENLNATKVRKLDTLTARVSFENGEEQYSDVRQNRVSRAGFSAAGGAWSEGEFGTLLRQTQQLLKTQQIAVQAITDQGGTSVALLGFDVAGEDSPWTLVVEGRSYKIPFRTEVLVETGSGHILSVKRSALQIPREVVISEIEWAVQLGATNLNGETWLLPSHAEYSVSYARSNRREHNQMSFGNYRRYGAEAALRFDLTH